MNLLFSYFLISILCIQAAANTPQKSENALQFKYQITNDHSVVVNIKDGFHINDKAPNRLIVYPENKKVPITKLEKQSVTFQFPPINEKQSVMTAVYVCDDALTVCEEHRKSWRGNGELIKNESAQKHLQQIESISNKPSGPVISLEQAQANCLSDNKPIILSFSAPWCPGCMRMDAEIWSQNKYQNIFAKFHKVKIDTDRFENKSIQVKYEISAIPATLVLNCKGQELERFMDYQQPELFIQTLQKMAKITSYTTHDELVKNAAAGDQQSALILAERAASAYSNKEALKWFSKVTHAENSLFYWWANIAELNSEFETNSNPANRKNLTRALKAAVDKFPHTFSSLDWRLQLASLTDSELEGKQLLNSLVQFCQDVDQSPQLFNKFLKNEPSGDYRGIEKLKIYEVQASAYALLKNNKLEQQTWQKGVSYWDHKFGKKDNPSGPFFRFLIFLKKTNNIKRLDNFFNKALSKSPNDPELLRRYAQTLYDFEFYDRARDYSLAAVQASYGRNEIFAANLHAKSLAKLNKKSEARRFLLKYQSQPELPEKIKVDIHKLLNTELFRQ